MHLYKLEDKQIFFYISTRYTNFLQIDIFFRNETIIRSYKGILRNYWGKNFDKTFPLFWQKVLESHCSKLNVLTIFFYIQTTFQKYQFHNFTDSFEWEI